MVFKKNYKLKQKYLLKIDCIVMYRTFNKKDQNQLKKTKIIKKYKNIYGNI